MDVEHEFKNRCIEIGMRPTRERLRVVREIFSRPRVPFRVEEIIESLVDEPVSRASVYRVLSILVSFGMLSQPDSGEFVYHFISRTDDPNPP